MHISESFKTESADYPHPWSVTDRSTWKGSIGLDTIINPEDGKPYLAVSELTLYIFEPSPNSPMDNALRRLEHVRDFKVYACPGATFMPKCIPIGCDSILVDKIDPSVPGYINVPGNRWDTSSEMMKHDWVFSKVVIHWLDINYLDYVVYYTAIEDNSYNQLSGNVDVINGRMVNKVNLSHNKYTGMMSGWDFWLDVSDLNVPNVQYNEIPIPEEILDTDFWRKNHECFIGNPGYQPPKEQ